MKFGVSMAFLPGRDNLPSRAADPSAAAEVIMSSNILRPDMLLEEFSRLGSLILGRRCSRVGYRRKKKLDELVSKMAVESMHKSL